jgi:hypothetical protein
VDSLIGENLIGCTLYPGSMIPAHGRQSIYVSAGITDPGYSQKPIQSHRGARFLDAMKKNDGHIPRGRRVMDYSGAAMERMELYCAAHPGSPSAVRRPRLLFRSDLWIALLGPSIEEGIVGIGPTVAAALRAFDAQYLAGLRPPSEAAGTASTQQPDAVARRPYRRPKSTAKSRAEVSGPPELPEREMPNDFGTTANAL